MSNARLPHLSRRHALAGAGGVTAAIALGTLGAPSARAGADARPATPTVVLVHGAWADGSSWNEVIRELARHGQPAVALANPLRDLTSDAAYIATVVGSIPGPVVLVGHSYGGAVITNAARSTANVKALVYVAAFAPDAGESLGSIGDRFGSDIGAHFQPQPYPKPDGTMSVELTIKRDDFDEVFARGVGAQQAALMAATQRPITGEAAGGPSGAPAWKTLPSWYQVSTHDRALPPAAQQFMASRMGARTIELPAPHASMLTHPRAVAHLIRAAVRV